jgi:hypothetical protein
VPERTKQLSGIKLLKSKSVRLQSFFQETKQSIQFTTNCKRFFSFSSSVSLEVPAPAGKLSVHGYVYIVVWKQSGCRHVYTVLSVHGYVYMAVWKQSACRHVYTVLSVHTVGVSLAAGSPLMQPSAASTEISVKRYWV